MYKVEVMKMLKPNFLKLKILANPLCKWLIKKVEKVPCSENDALMKKGLRPRGFFVVPSDDGENDALMKKGLRHKTVVAEAAAPR